MDVAVTLVAEELIGSVTFTCRSVKKLTAAVDRKIVVGATAEAHTVLRVTHSLLLHKLYREGSNLALTHILGRALSRRFKRRHGILRW